MSDMQKPIAHAASGVADQEMAILTEIGAILSSTLEAKEMCGRIMQIMSDKMDMRRGTLVLLDESTGRLRTEAAVGLAPDDIEQRRPRCIGNIADMCAGELKPQVVLRKQNPSNAGEIRGLMISNPQQLGQGESGEYGISR